MNKLLFFGFMTLNYLGLFAQGLSENSGYLVKPTVTPHGVIATDNYGSGLYLIQNGICRRIYSAPGAGNYFTLTPDKNKIITKVNDNNGMQKLVSITIETGEVKPITGDHPLMGQASFSVGGVFVYSEGEKIIVVDQGSKKEYKTESYSNLTPISPDGKFVVYNDKNDVLYLLNLSSGLSTKFSPDNQGFFAPQWSFDSQYILFSSLKGGLHIYLLESNSVIYVVDGFNPSWGANSHSIVFEKRELADGVYGNSDLFMYDLSSGKVIQLTNTPQISEMTPAINSDGNLLYAVREEYGLYTSDYTAERGIVNKKVLFTADAKLKDMLLPLSIGQSSPKAMDIPYVHQVWDTPDWYNGHSACGATTAIMLIAYWNLLPPYEGWCSWPGSGHYNYWGRYVADRYRFRQVDYQSTADDPNGTPSYGGYGFMWTGSYSPYSRMTSYYANHGISAQREDAPTFAKADAQLSAGNPYSICNGLTSAGHIILAHGINSANRTVTVNDPYGNKNTPGYPSYDGKNASYDWPGYNNGNQNLNNVFWCINTSYQVPAHGDTLIDDLDFNRGFYLHNRLGANMLHWKDMTQGYKGHFWYAYTNTNQNDICYATWKPNLPVDGMYEVKVYIPFSNATEVVYRIFRYGGMTEVTINQNQFTNQWVSLGVHPFKAGSAGSLRLGDKSSVAGQELVFDAVQWNLVDPVLEANETATDVIYSFGIQSNYPNPFNPETQISFSLAAQNHATLTIYNILGGIETVLVDGVLDAGNHKVVFNGNAFSSGIYLAVLKSGGRTAVQKLSLIK